MNHIGSCANKKSKAWSSDVDDLDVIWEYGHVVSYLKNWEWVEYQPVSPIAKHSYIFLGLQSLHDGFIEISDEGSHEQENRIL